MMYRFSAFWLRSKCSICSYQLNIWYGPHCGSRILNWFLNIGGALSACTASSTGRPGIAVPPGLAHLHNNSILVNEYHWRKTNQGRDEEHGDSYLLRDCHVFEHIAPSHVFNYSMIFRRGHAQSHIGFRGCDPRCSYGSCRWVTASYSMSGKNRSVGVCFVWYLRLQMGNGKSPRWG